MTKETKIIAGLLAGAALGAAVALILSTDKGEDLKGSVADWLADVIDASKDKLAGVSDAVKETVQDSISKVTS
jgi:gas vesicle protein